MADALEPTGLDYAGRQAYLDWVNRVHANSLGVRGDAVAVRLGAQAGKYQGVLGAMYSADVIQSRGLGEPLVWTTGQKFGEYLAPLNVRLLDKAHAVDDAITIALGKGAEEAEKAAKGLVVVAVLAVVGVGLALYASTRHPR